MWFPEVERDTFVPPETLMLPLPLPLMLVLSLLPLGSGAGRLPRDTREFGAGAAARLGALLDMDAEAPPEASTVDIVEELAAGTGASEAGVGAL